MGLLASILLAKEPGSSIVYEPRVIWNTQDIIEKNGGVSVVSRMGHAFIKETMRRSNAIYGGEISAHHFFRDFAFCDSGMIPWLMIIELICENNTTLGNLIRNRSEKFMSSGEINFSVKDPEFALEKVLKNYRGKAKIDTTDGLSLSFDYWRLNLRKSNTENLLRLNVESYEDKEIISLVVKEISEIINGNHTF